MSDTDESRICVRDGYPLKEGVKLFREREASEAFDFLIGYDSQTPEPRFGVVDNRIGAERREVIRPDYDEHTPRVTPSVPLRRD